MPYDATLVDRIRQALAKQQRPVREVSMFGGLTFMVNEKMAAVAKATGALMVRCDPDVTDDLLQRTGAEWPEMRGRPMTKGWIVVQPSGIGSKKDVDFWLKQALAYNAKSTK